MRNERLGRSMREGGRGARVEMVEEEEGQGSKGGGERRKGMEEEEWRKGGWRN